MEKRRRNLALLAGANFCLSFALMVQISSFMNFLKEDIGIKPMQYGVLESLRETPGILTVVLIALTVRFLEPRLAAGCLFIFSIGIAGYCRVHSLPSLILTSVIWSIGFHLWLPVYNSMMLRLAGAGQEGRWLGIFRSVTALSAIAALSIVFVFGNDDTYRYIFLFAGVVGALGAICCLGISKDVGVIEKQKLVFKKKYWLYYLLTFLEGTRKQIFLSFALFAMVNIGKTSVQDVAFLTGINTVVLFIEAPRVGRWIDKVGERKVLSLNYLGLCLIFTGYALTTRSSVFWGVLFCLDNFFTVFNISLTTYLNKIAKREDITPTLAAGVTMNHIAAVIVPVTGFAMWGYFGHYAPFIGGACLAVVSLAAAQWIGNERSVEEPIQAAGVVVQQTGASAGK